jgi:hypothetical protein
MPDRHPSKSGQAIIFLMVVMVIGLLVVVWNFDLHRIISAKLRMRNAADSAALAAARWQGKTLNMIGDLNLIQAAIISTSYEEVDGEDEDGDGEADYTDIEFYVPDEAADLHDLRSRLEFVGPLAAYAVAQQTAFNNGAHHDPDLASNLVAMAENIRYKVARAPYDNAYKEYADLLDLLAENGVAVGSYSLTRQRHPLTQEKFYGAIAQALKDWWCPFRRYRYQLENYEGYESWGKLNTEFKSRYVFDLKLDEFDTGFIERDDGEVVPKVPSSAMPAAEDFLDELYGYLSSNEVVETFGEPGMIDGIYADELTDVEWHVYHNSWAKGWPRASYYDDETEESGGRFPIRENVRSEYNYMGAEAGVGIAAPVGRGILASTGNETVELGYKAKAKPFGFLDISDPDLSTGGYLAPPNYYGFVFPAFDDVRLIHSDIGDKIINARFYRHVTEHLEPYLESGTSACEPGCSYCRLLVQWETLDRQRGLEWLEEAYSSDDENPCKADADAINAWGKAGGGATGGS